MTPSDVSMRKQMVSSLGGVVGSSGLAEGHRVGGGCGDAERSAEVIGEDPLGEALALAERQDRMQTPPLIAAGTA